MKKLIAIVLAVMLLSMGLGAGIASAGSGDDDWPMFHYDAANTGYTDADAPDTNAVAWVYDTVGPAIESSPAIVDGKLYIGSLNGNLYALSANSGSLLWAFPAGGPIHSSPAVADGKVYFLDESGTVYALDADTGSVAWSTPAGGGSWDWSSPAVHDGNVFIATSDGSVHSLDASTGGINWSTNIGAEPNSMIAVANGKVYSGTHNFDNSAPTLVALNEATGAVIWTYDYYLYHAGGVGMVDCNGAAVADGDGDGDLDVYFGVYNWGSAGPQAVCLDEATGVENWAVSIGGNSTSTPAVHNGVVFIGSDDNNVYALDAGTGAVNWTYTTGGDVWSSPAVADGKVFVGSWDHTLYALDEATGALVWSYYTGTSRLYASPAVANERVFIGSENGKVYAFGPISVDKELVSDAVAPVEVGQDTVFVLEITVTNNDTASSITDVVVKDNFGADLEVDRVVSCSQGTPTIYNSKAKKSPQYRLSWDVGTLAPTASAILVIEVSTDINPAGKQEYTEPGEHCLNSGANAKGIFLDEQVSATSDPICVEVVEPDLDNFS